MAHKTANPAGSLIAVALAVAVAANALSGPAHAQSAPAPTAAALSTGEFVQAVTTLSLFSQKAGKLAEVLGQTDDVRRFGRHLADDRRPLQTLNKGLAAARIDPPLISSLPANQDGLLQTLHRTDDLEFDRMFTELQVQAQREALAIVQAYAQTGGDPVVRGTAARLAPVFQDRLDQALSMQKSAG